MSNEPQRQGAGIKQLRPGEVAPHLAHYQVVDVRDPGEFEGPLGHIDGAVNIPLSTLPDQLSTLDPGKSLLVVCRSGARSMRACQLLAAQGFNDITNLTGGMLAWRAQG